ncbi:3-isopropylmalate dehydratase small subunit [Roseibium sp.]|uniref:3-isopropylmalate dehydratase small subunit n=1 Tax=Roseibium sp. TaxID=1936156 RepID=UPI003B52CA61
MESFTTLKAIAAPLPAPNIDTDVIMPKQFLKRIDRAGLAEGAFHELRFDESGTQRPEFILNQPPYDQAKILIAGKNFGCGSSREYAVWGLMQLGFRVIIAPSIAGIFFGNCEKNGLLAITLPETEVEHLLRATATSATAEMTINLPDQTIQTASGQIFGFEIATARKKLLLTGADHIQLTLDDAETIIDFEKKYFELLPWIAKRTMPMNGM